MCSWLLAIAMRRAFAWVARRWWKIGINMAPRLGVKGLRLASLGFWIERRVQIVEVRVGTVVVAGM